MPPITITVPAEALSALRLSPEELARALPLAAAVHWYSRREVTAEIGARIAGLSMSDFLIESARRQRPLMRGTGRKLSEFLASIPTGTRTKEDIDRQIDEERDLWDKPQE